VAIRRQPNGKLRGKGKKAKAISAFAFFITTGYLVQQASFVQQASRLLMVWLETA
jgi:hypothetical protein